MLIYTARHRAQVPTSPAPIQFVATTFRQRDQWSRKTARDRRVKLMHRHVLRSLADCARTDKDGKLVVDPTYNELAKAAGCCKRTTMRAIAVAEEIGIVRKARRSDGRVSNVFELLLPNIAANGIKNAEKASEKTQEIQRPTVTNFAADESSNGDSAVVEGAKPPLQTLSDRVPSLPREANGANRRANESSFPHRRETQPRALTARR